MDFERDPSGQVPYTDENIDILLKYVIPVISRNSGWATDELTEESFLDDLEYWRDTINATVLATHKGQVRVALVDDKPVGLLEYIQEDFDDMEEVSVSETLWKMLESKEEKSWKKLISYGFLDESILDKYHKDLKEYVTSKKLYRGVGVVVSPELQGKKTGVSDNLYSLLKGGFVIGSTSSPIVLYMRNKIFDETLFFPLLDRNIETLPELACLLVIASRVLTKDVHTLEGFEFGVKTHPEYVLRKRSEYLALTKSFLDAGKITPEDYKRFEYMLNFERGQGGIISVW